MGQNVSALMVGTMLDVKLDAALHDEDGDPVWNGRCWCKVPEMSEDRECMGFVFAVSRNCETGEAELSESIPIGKLAGAFPEEREAARGRWFDFAGWLKEHYGIVLPEPEIILTEVERA